MLEPFFQSFTIPWGTIDFAVSDTVKVPAGKMLIVEFVSVKAFIPTGESITVMELSAEKGKSHSLVWQLVGSKPELSVDVFAASQQIRMYTTFGLWIELVRHKKGNQIGFGHGDASAVVTGHLVKAS
jgi:hypothetical protein